MMEVRAAHECILRMHRTQAEDLFGGSIGREGDGRVTVVGCCARHSV